jgi:hypothetical protein
MSALNDSKQNLSLKNYTDERDKKGFYLKGSAMKME